MKKIAILSFAAAALGVAGLAAHSTAEGVSADALAKVIASSWKDPNAKNPEGAKPDWASRLTQDNLQKVCSQTHNQPDKELAADIQAAAKASVQYPEDGKLLGDWKAGEKIAQDGKGQRYNDKVDAPSGGNCYACHQIDKAELAYGTIGPSLAEYGKLRDFTEEATKATYEKIFNAHTAIACSNMPRFGAQGILTIQQIKDVTALLMAKDSPVNK
ncbi:MAG: sulfur oxidation c-type cytochrome SoxX [Hyphomicrobiaceae bacterium]